MNAKFNPAEMWARIDKEEPIRTRPFHAGRKVKRVPFTINHKAYRAIHRAKKSGAILAEAIL